MTAPLDPQVGSLKPIRPGPVAFWVDPPAVRVGLTEEDPAAVDGAVSELVPSKVGASCDAKEFVAVTVTATKLGELDGRVLVSGL